MGMYCPFGSTGRTRGEAEQPGCIGVEHLDGLIFSMIEQDIPGNISLRIHRNGLSQSCDHNNAFDAWRYSNRLIRLSLQVNFCAPTHRSIGCDEYLCPGNVEPLSKGIGSI